MSWDQFRRYGRVVSATLLLACTIYAQSDRGTITGLITDAAGAVIPNASVTATHSATGTGYRTRSSSAGVYLLANLPAGTYDVAVEVTGFKKYVGQGAVVEVAQTTRLDVPMQVGAVSDSVTVTADTPLLRTEDVEQSTTYHGDHINNIPLNFAMSSGGGAIRNPLNFVQLAPGSSYNGWNDIRVNGSPNGTFRIIYEGQDSTSALDPRVSDEAQPSVESIQEFTLQTSNFAAQFGQVTGGLFNFTSRSGTRRFHGSAFAYLANEALNAGTPFTSDGNGNHLRDRLRRFNYGFSAGGPLILPKIYDGREKTFFFVVYESYRDKRNVVGNYITVPTDAYRRGDFSGSLTGRQLASDPLGTVVMENTVYDPGTGRVVNGLTVRDPFPNNVIPVSRFDPVAVRIQALFPKPVNTDRTLNFQSIYPYKKLQQIPSVKIDHTFSPAFKMSAYYSTQGTQKDNNREGFPIPITTWRDQIIRSHTVRLNFDRAITPTTLLNFGVGYIRYHNPDGPPAAILDFDTVKELGLNGALATGFPRITGLSANLGGIQNIGPTSRTLYVTDKPTAVTSLTMIRGSHAYKVGADWRFENFTNRNTNGTSGTYNFSAAQTGLPSTQGIALGGGGVGFNYASFLLGLVNDASINNVQDPQYRKGAFSAFAQDTWKITPKLTLDYGLRWDFQPAPHELRHRTSAFAPNTHNPSAGGILGAMAYEGDGPGRCNCSFTSTYKYAFGPRLGLAYQINKKTVLRAGWGITYGHSPNFNYITGSNSLGMGFNSLTFSNIAYGEPGAVLQRGLSYNLADLTSATYNAGLRPSPGQLNSPPPLVDANGGRPPRINQWSIGLQRQLARTYSVEAAYVGNRGVWFPANSLVDPNALTPERIRAAGLDINSAADRAILTGRLDAAAARARGIAPPYNGYPLSATVAQSLRPYPQFGALSVQWAAMGNTWYDSLQAKLNKRFSRSFSLSLAYTFSKNEGTVEDQSGETIPVNDVFNRRNQKAISRVDQPHILVASYNYETPRVSHNRIANTVFGNWTLAGVLRYASGLPIKVPAATNNLSALLFRGTFVNRVPGEPLFLKDINCHGCFDPQKDFVLNPKAWTDPAAGQWGTAAAYYSDYRYRRRPNEQMSIGKMFRVKEGVSLQLRAEFFNIFNRTVLNDPASTSAFATQLKNADGRTVSGFGYINTGGVAGNPRNGQFVLRLQF